MIPFVPDWVTWSLVVLFFSGVAVLMWLGATQLPPDE